MKFHAVVEQGGKTATGITVPDEIVDALGAGRKPTVSVTINGYTYRTSIATVSGSSKVGVSAEVREAAGVKGGDELDVEIALDTAPREVAVPPDFAAALDGRARRAGHLRPHQLQREALVRARHRGREDARDAPAPHRQGHRTAARGSRTALMPAVENITYADGVAAWLVRPNDDAAPAGPVRRRRAVALVLAAAARRPEPVPRRGARARRSRRGLPPAAGPVSVVRESRPGLTTTSQRSKARSRGSPPGSISSPTAPMSTTYRLAVVGHDFGAMLASIVAAREQRVRAAVLIAPTPRWGDWFLPFWEIDEERSPYLRALEPLDPQAQMASIAPRPVLLQLAERDYFVPLMAGFELRRASGERHALDVRQYDADHEMTSERRAARPGRVPGRGPRAGLTVRQRRTARRARPREQPSAAGRAPRTRCRRARAGSTASAERTSRPRSRTPPFSPRSIRQPADTNPSTRTAPRRNTSSHWALPSTKSCAGSRRSALRSLCPSSMLS